MRIKCHTPMRITEYFSPILLRNASSSVDKRCAQQKVGVQWPAGFKGYSQITRECEKTMELEVCYAPFRMT